MLGDNPEKSRNPLKKAMRRRNAKAVAFAEPTYYDAPIRDYSSDEGSLDGETLHSEEIAEDHNDDQQDISSDIKPIEPLQIRSSQGEANDDEIHEDVRPQDAQNSQKDDSRTSDDAFDRQGKLLTFSAGG